MLSRAEQIDVLRYWEEIELLTPPDYQVVENAGKNPSSIPNAPLEAW